MHEIDVIRQTRAFLQRDGLLGHRVLDLYTDAHPTLLADTALRPFQRFMLAFNGFSVHPDLVGRLSDGETMFAVEARGEGDLLRGIAQADTYRPGFHLVLFAFAGMPSRDLMAIARRHDVGVLAVRLGQVEQLRHARSIQQQLVVTTMLSRSSPSTCRRTICALCRCSPPGITSAMAPIGPTSGHWSRSHESTITCSPPAAARSARRSAARRSSGSSTSAGSRRSSPTSAGRLSRCMPEAYP
jgi:hypothetical protein